MKYTKYIAMMVVAGGMLAATSCSDYSDYNSVPEDANAMAGQTLYENIKSKSNLKDFAAIIDKAGYANVLNASQCYTVWAPEDGTYDAASILAKDSAYIVDRFLKHHIAQFSYPVSGEVDANVTSLNEKHHEFKGVKYDESELTEVNIPSSNGLLHVINAASPYYCSLYETLYETEGCDKFVDFIMAYNDSVIDLRNSIPGPMVNGQQSYLDTVWRYTNPVISSILRAQIENEDSSYVMLMPTDKAWDDAYAQVKPLYNYVTNFTYMDIANSTLAAASVKANTQPSATKIAIDKELYNDSLPKYFMTRDLVYSLSYPQNSPLETGKLIGGQYPDTVYSTGRTKVSNVEELLSHCGETNRMSNGYTRIIDTLCFKSYQTYDPILSVKQPVRVVGMKAGSSYSRYQVLQQSLWPSRDTLFSELPDFLKSMIMPKTSNYITYISCDSANYGTSAKPELDFALQNVRSQKYKIYVVFTPFSHTATGDAYIKKRDLYVRFDMAYNKEDGSQAYQRINVPGAAKPADDIIVPGNGRYNYVELDFEFPISYYGIDAFPTLFVSHTKAFTTATNREKFEQELRIVGVYLVPESATEYVNNLKF